MLGSILGGIGSALGGLFGMSAADKNREAQERMAAENIALQKQFAQEGIRWKVADAKAAGIHPLYALGASTTSFSPVSIGQTEYPDFSKSLGSMGQDIGNAISRTSTAQDRTTQFATEMGRLTVEGAGLDNDIKRAALASSLQRLRANSNPPFPAMSDLSGPNPAGKFGDVPRMSLGSGEIRTDRGISNTDDATKRWGESADWWYGPYVMFRDYVANHGNPISESWGDNIRPGSLLDRFYRTGREFDSRWKGYRNKQW